MQFGIVFAAIYGAISAHCGRLPSGYRKHSDAVGGNRVIACDIRNTHHEPGRVSYDSEEEVSFARISFKVVIKSRKVIVLIPCGPLIFGIYRQGYGWLSQESNCSKVKAPSPENHSTTSRSPSSYWGLSASRKTQKPILKGTDLIYVIVAHHFATQLLDFTDYFEKALEMPNHYSPCKINQDSRHTVTILRLTLRELQEGRSPGSTRNGQQERSRSTWSEEIDKVELD